MFSIKALAMATAVSAGTIFAMPVASQAMPASSPVRIQMANDSNIVNVRYYRRMSWSQYCATHRDWRCRSHYGYHRYRYRYYEEPYYGYGGPYYGYYPYGPRYYRPGLHLPLGMGIY